MILGDISEVFTSHLGAILCLVPDYSQLENEFQNCKKIVKMRSWRSQRICNLKKIRSNDSWNFEIFIANSSCWEMLLCKLTSFSVCFSAQWLKSGAGMTAAPMIKWFQDFLQFPLKEKKSAPSRSAEIGKNRCLIISRACVSPKLKTIAEFSPLVPTSPRNPRSWATNTALTPKSCESWPKVLRKFFENFDKSRQKVTQNVQNNVQRSLQKSFKSCYKIFKKTRSPNHRAPKPETETPAPRTPEPPRPENRNPNSRSRTPEESYVSLTYLSLTYLMISEVNVYYLMLSYIILSYAILSSVILC